ncbi:uncharacterized protein LOC109830729 isoform X3 [Asparagus officinalis]|uniref:uncharacterized protein LOC109830729 isoform X3 n=1 Tax=Asparagus officinalis TaxID=4686 RepID=UPI00098E01F8|nr:uncharacterized protein LOC109830729 isoform X3 [Asparagus officinalis]
MAASLAWTMLLHTIHKLKGFSLLVKNKGHSLLQPKKMSFEQANAYRRVKPITISYSDLMDKERDLSDRIEEALGPEGLGIILISDVPEFSLLRKNLLHLSPVVASLHDDVRVSIEDPSSRFGIGWSHGNERLESNKVDVYKGSFAANPILDVPTTDVSLMQRYPSFCCPNKWPSSALPELEVAFKALGKMILDVGLKLAYHCDKYGLTSGMFTRNSEVVACPDSAGLYIKARNSEIVKVVFGEDELAYQIGDTLEIISGRRLCATPHCVRAPSLEEAAGVARASFAMFMQPDWDEDLKLGDMSNPDIKMTLPNENVTFGEYSEAIICKSIT